MEKKENYFDREMKTPELVKQVTRTIAWAAEKGIFKKGTTVAQAAKVVEEAKELQDEIGADNRAAALIELGDVAVTIIVLAEQLGTTVEHCLELAMDKNEKRSGQMIDGTFVKDSK
jgi:NTP pyrophosphatase (non-canonical NTP hydrolase)